MKGILKNMNAAGLRLGIRSSAAIATLCLGVGATAVPVLAVPGVDGAASTSILAQDTAGQSDPALKQQVKDDETFAPRGQKHAFTRGHADLGVRLDKESGGGLTMMLRDDAQEKPVWRHLEDVVFVAGNNSKQELPEGSDYDFTGAHAGQKVFVLPQTEKQGVPWLGWNTQSPALVKDVQKGVTMQLLGHQGPGQLTMFLQAGGFAKPQKIFSTGEPMPQGMWVDSNTHAHANWTFTEPGVHRVALGITAKTNEGKEIKGTKIVTFAVGVDPQEAFGSGWEGSVPSADASSGSVSSGQQGGNSSANGEAADNKSAESDGSNTMKWVLIGVVAVVALMAVVGFMLMRSGRSTRREAEEQLRELRERRQQREARERRENRSARDAHSAREDKRGDK